MVKHAQASASAGSHGARLEYVVRPLKQIDGVTYGDNGEPITRTIHKFDTTLNAVVPTDVVVKEPLFMVYMADGRSYRFTAMEVRRAGLHKPPKILNFDAIREPSQLGGAYKFGRTDAERDAGYRELEELLIKRCRAKRPEYAEQDIYQALSGEDDATNDVVGQAEVTDVASKVLAEFDETGD